MRFSQLQFAVSLALGLCVSMENRATSASNDVNGKLVEHRSKFEVASTSLKAARHEDVAPPEPARTQKRLDDHCALFAEYQTMAKALPKTFDLLDKNRDGLLTREELRASIEDSSLNSTEGGLLAGFYENFDQMSSLSRTFWGGKKFDRDTLRVFLETVKKSEPLLLPLRTAWLWTESKEPAEVGLDFQKGCTKESLLKASQAGESSATGQSSIRLMVDNFDSFSSEGMLTRDSLTQYYRKLRRSNDDFAITFYIEDSMEMAQTLDADKPSQTLYWHKHEPLNDIRSNNIIQGHAGDCTFKSALCELASSRPENIVKMIRQVSAHTFSVTFPGHKPIEVNAPSWAEQVLYEPNLHSGLWLNILEKAYASAAPHDQKFKEFDGRPTEEKTALMWQSELAIGFLTGHKTTKLLFANVNEKDAMKAIRKAFSSPVKPIILAGTQEPHDKRLDHNHSFALVKILGASGSKEETLVLKNPLGYNNADPSAEISLSPHQFWENFNDVSIEQIK